MKRAISLALAALMAGSAMLFTSCSQRDPNTLYVGQEPQYPPMEYLDKDGTAIGFDNDLAKAIADKLGKKLEIKSTAWDGIFLGLDANTYDCIISSVSITPDREKKMEFTKPYISNSQMIVVKPGDTSVTKVDDLKDKRVGAQDGTTATEALDKIKGRISMTVKPYKEVGQPFLDLDAGNLDAVVVDEVVGQYYIAKNPAKYAAAAAKLDNEPIGIAFKKGNTELRDKVQKALDELAADGTLKTLSEKWFATDLTSNIDATYRDVE